MLMYVTLVNGNVIETYEIRHNPKGQQVVIRDRNDTTSITHTYLPEGSIAAITVEKPKHL